MKLAPDDLDTITATTLGHYQQVAEDFREGTRDHDVSQNIDALLRHIQGPAPFSVLDFGCGPGRDLQTFTRLGQSPSASTAASVSPRWPGTTAAARSGSRTFSS